MKKSLTYRAISDALYASNPVTKQTLGICSSLAVTVKLNTAMVMGLSLTVVVAFSSLIISSLRHQIPRNIRIIVEVAVIATLVIIADELLRAFLFDISKQLSVFVGLIITNCIVMGRAESYALANAPGRAFIDGMANGIGYASILVSVALIREIFGSGQILGFQVVPEAFYQAGYANMGIMLLAPGAFIVIGLLTWLQNSVMHP